MNEKLQLIDKGRITQWTENVKQRTKAHKEVKGMEKEQKERTIIRVESDEQSQRVIVSDEVNASESIITKDGITLRLR